MATEPETVSGFAALERQEHALIGHLTGGLSPLALATAGFDWWTHLVASPVKQAELWHKGWSDALSLSHFACEAARGAAPDTEATDKRFRAEEWAQFPFNVMAQSFLKTGDWWNAATRDVYGVEEKHERIVNFAARQILDTVSPGNVPLTNPTVLKKTIDERGDNLVRGWRYFREDLDLLLGGQRETGEYIVGKTVAATPGRVVFRNRLIELIAYEATTKTVHSEPLLIVPAWIMKYYILDLSERNSLVRWLTAQGFTVFMVSWTNPREMDRELSLEDYRREGFEAALDTVSRLIPDTRIHVAGYCLGGSLLSIGAATLAQQNDTRLASMSLLAAQVDFEDAGELTLFINESQIAFLEDIMAEQGYLRADQMAGAFKMLRSNDLIWSRVIRHYLLGERSRMNDLMAWNADTTRMPARMHSEYLRQLFLDNDLAENRYRVDGKPLSLTDLKVPIFALGTERDHVSPWHSVFKIASLTDTDVTFALASGGHNGGVVTQPGKGGSHYRIETLSHDAPFVSADDWFARNPERDGSWWTAWSEWLAGRSGAQRVNAAEREVCLFAEASDDAPGQYVRER